MKKFFWILPLLFCFTAYADQAALDAALRDTYINCVGINDELSELKTRAGINTAVTGVGTAAGAGALVVGLMRSNELFPKLKEMNVDKSKKMQPVSGAPQPGWTPNLKSGGKSKSKTLGNWRTGLLAANTATNIAGAIIAGNNRGSDNLHDSVEKCQAAVKTLNDAIIAARVEDVDVSEAVQIYNACGDFVSVDMSKISDRATGAMVSSIVGAGVGATGTVVSAVANTDENMNNEKLDTASNILAGGATIASGAATIFNATQIAAIRKVADVAQKCEDALK